jgi:integrase
MLYPAELWALDIGKSDRGDPIFLASSTALFYGRTMKERKAAVRTWEKTRLSYLVRHKRTGGYYARAYANGKEVWRSLKTKHFSVAESRLAEFLKGHRETRNAQAQASSAKLTFGAAAAIYRQRLNDNVKIKPRTREYYAEILASLKKSWLNLSETEVRRVTPAQCRDWAARVAKGSSATRFNNSVAVLRHVFDVAIECGVIYSNPAAMLKRKSIRQKTLTLPTRAQFAEFVRTMETAGGRDSRNCADFVRGMALTGCRLGEAREIQWRDLEFESGMVVVRGDPIGGTKNSEVRRVPMIAEARTLFERMRATRPNEPKDEKVFLVRECQKAMDRAARLVGMARITHHDLRHLFATICIESGVDVPTVATWLGHKDGGALAMKTYKHLRDEHSLAAAKKVNFAPATKSPEKVIAFPATA